MNYCCCNPVGCTPDAWVVVQLNDNAIRDDAFDIVLDLHTTIGSTNFDTDTCVAKCFMSDGSIDPTILNLRCDDHSLPTITTATFDGTLFTPGAHSLFMQFTTNNHADNLGILAVFALEKQTDGSFKECGQLMGVIYSGPSGSSFGPFSFTV